MPRPLKSNIILNKMTLAYDPQSEAPLAFAGHIPDIEELLPSGVSEKASHVLRKLSDLVEKTLEDTSKEGVSGSDSKAELEMLRNLAWGDTPEKAIILAEKMSFVSERTKSCLLKHLAEQEILLQELRAIAQIARRRILDELSEVDPTMVDFTNKLVAAGIVNKDVRFLSYDKLSAIVSIIKGVDNEDKNGGIPPFLQKLDVLRKPQSFPALDENEFQSSFRRNGNDEKIEQNQLVDKKADSAGLKPSQSADNGPDGRQILVDSGAVQDSEIRSNSSSEGDVLKTVLDSEKTISGSDLAPVPGEKSSSDQLLKDQNDSRISVGDRAGNGNSKTDELPFFGDRNVRDIPVSGGKIQEGSVPGKPAKKAAPYDWNDMDIISMGYMFDGAVASTDADMEALKIVLPTERKLTDLVDPKTQSALYALAKSAFETANKADFDRFMDQYLAMNNRHMSEMERRIWALLLVDYPNRSSSMKLNPHGYYHGIVLPGLHGTAKVRRVVLLRRDPDFVKHAYIF